jgi:hypothetical protein
MTRFCLAPLVGLRRGQPVEIDLPPVAAPADLAGAVTAVAASVAEGRLTPEEGGQLSRMLAGFPRVLAAGGAAKERPSDEEVYENLIQELDRLAARVPKEERRAQLLAELAALDAETLDLEAAPLDVSVAEQQEDDQQNQQQAADPDPAAIAVTPVAPAAAADQQQDQHNQNDQAHTGLRLFRPPSGILNG